MMGDQERGASPAAIAAHYDVSDAFYSLWLDPTLTYSCALWATANDTLENAQLRKLDFHAREVGCPLARRVLDIGCGWGSMLRRLVDVHEVGKAVGLTLSRTQEAWIKDRELPGVEVRLESWEHHSPSEPYDGIVSIGALEHFVRPSLTHPERVDVYRRFFQKCRSLLRANGRLSLQTSAYSRGQFVTGAIASIFPESDLPRLDELVTAAQGVLELVSVRNDREDYARTCGEWLKAMRSHRDEAVSLVGVDTVLRFERFLEAAVKGFELEIFHLLRLTLKRFDPAH
jgi:cyclopropane-fatty-acyl-phospholipid synthase